MSKNTVSGLKAFHEAVKQIRTGKLLSVYVLSGDEIYFSDRIQDELLAHIPADMRDFNLDILYGNESDISKVIEVCRSFPMMSERRMVIVREFMGLFDPSAASAEDESKGGTKGDVDLLMSYLQKPNPQTVLILRDEKTPAGNTTFGKALQKMPQGLFLKFAEVPELELADWIETLAELTYSMKIEPEAARLMAQRMGPQLQLVSNELDKLCTENRTGEPITVSMIREKIPVSREFTVFELKEHVLNRNTDRAFYIAERLLHQGSSDVGETFKTIAFFYNLFSNLWVYQRLTAKGLALDEIQSQLGVAKSFYYLQQDARVFKPKNWADVFEALHDADRAIKGYSKLEADVIFLMMLKRIMTA